MRTLVNYNELVEYALQQICALCDNVDSLKPTIPADMYNGYSRVVQQSSKQTVTMKVNDSTVKVVKSSTVRSELITYLSNNGVYSKTGAKVNAKGILNFFNFVSSFISGHVFLVTNNITGSSCRVYVTGSGAIPPVSRVAETEYTDGRPNEVLFTSDMNSSNLTSLTNAISNTLGAKSLN